MESHTIVHSLQKFLDTFIVEVSVQSKIKVLDMPVVKQLEDWLNCVVIKVVLLQIQSDEVLQIATFSDQLSEIISGKLAR